MRILNASETRFKFWLEAQSLPHIFVDQSTETHGSCMDLNFKRPDFIVAVPNLGIAGFDIKDKAPHAKGDFILDYEREVEKYRNLQSIFMFSCWYCFLSTSEAGHSRQWYFISINDVLDEPVRFSRNMKSPFHSVRPQSCISICPDSDSLLQLFEPKKRQFALPFCSRLN